MKENAFFFLCSYLLSRFYCESPRDSKTVKSRFRNPEFRSVLRRHCGGRIEQKQTTFIPALDTSYLITKMVKLNNFLQNI